jgi:hypothetical protein
MLTGIRFTDTPLVFDGFHSFDATTSCTFTDAPEPGTIGLLAAGCCCLLVARRRKTVGVAVKSLNREL